jgi:pSer/pThr/pTyr-binding forkhead associated (FHA) protein
MVAAPVIMAELVVEEGPDAGQRFPLKPNTRLGRAADNEIVLRDPQVSRHQAVINLTGSEYVIADLGSANGTEVNGVRIDQPCLLRHGDVVVVGSDQLVFRQR